MANQETNDTKGNSRGDAGENSGGDVNYYLVRVSNPKRLKPYEAECEDIIEALGMTFAEGSAFKAIWRRCAERTLGRKKAGNSAKRDAEKVVYYGTRMLAQDLRSEIDRANAQFGESEIERIQRRIQEGNLVSEVRGPQDSAVLVPSRSYPGVGSRIVE